MISYAIDILIELLHSQAIHSSDGDATANLSLPDDTGLSDLSLAVEIICNAS
jgi:hypothetical protein